MYLHIQQVRDKILHPFAKALNRMGVQPDHLSYISLGTSLPFAFMAGRNLGLALVFLALHLLFDSLDGALARLQQKAPTTRGDLTDLAFDHAAFFIMVLALMSAQIIHSFWGAVYLLNYTIMLGIMIALHSMNIAYFSVLRSKNIIYLVFLILAVTEMNFFEPVILFLSIYMVITNLFLFHKLRCSLP